MSSPSTPRPVGRSPIAACSSGLDAVRDELDQLPVLADHAQRAVPRADQPARGYHDPLQGAAQVQIGADADDRVQQRPQSFAAVEHVADPVQQLVQELVQVHPRQRRQPE